MTSPSSALPATTRLSIAGPAGPLDARLDTARDPVDLRFLAVFGHPHPQHDGTMFNNVVVHGARELVEQGGAVLRFNFRGVGESAGKYDEGRGERDDYLCALDELRRQGTSLPGFHSDIPVLAAGFSFGAIRALENAADGRADLYLGVAPPVTLHKYGEIASVPVPAAVIEAGADELVPNPSDELKGRIFPHLCFQTSVDGAGHLFTGRLEDLRASVRGAIHALLRPSV